MAETSKKAAEKKESFLGGIKKEWKKILWPTKDELIKQTSLVVVISIIMGAVIAVIDSAALQLVNWLMSI
ncbi:MAG: preprotein translocase subunit SecE [Lachnospiraceae bacterium]|nr:preprotein translocase subunit SecE [Lachnospiraceae bacterium]